LCASIEIKKELAIINLIDFIGREGLGNRNRCVENRAGKSGRRQERKALGKENLIFNDLRDEKEGKVFL